MMLKTRYLWEVTKKKSLQLTVLVPTSRGSFLLTKSRIPQKRMPEGEVLRVASPLGRIPVGYDQLPNLHPLS